MPIKACVEPTQRPADRDLTRRDLPWILGVLAMVVAFVVLVALGHPLYGAALVGGVMFFSFWSMPRENREAVGREIERRERTLVGRVLKIIELLGGLLLLYVIAQAALSRF